MTSARLDLAPAKHTRRLRPARTRSLAGICRHFTPFIILVSSAPSTLLASTPDFEWLAGGNIGLTGVAITPDGSSLVTSSNEDHTVKMWSVADGSLSRTLTGHYGQVRAVAVSPDGDLIASTGEPVFGMPDEGVRLWSASDGAEVRTFATGYQQGWSVEFSPDGGLLAAGVGYDAKIWRVNDGSLVTTLSGHNNFVFDVAFSPDGSMLATASGDETIKLWRVADGSLVRVLAGHTFFVQTVAFSPDGATLVSGSLDAEVRVWRVSDGTQLALLTEHEDCVTSVMFAPDGETFATASWDHTIRIWSFPENSLVRTLHASDIFFVTCLDYFDDGARLASCAFDGHARIWNVETGVVLRTFGHHTADVRSVAYSRDGTVVGSASEDLTARLWRASDGTELRRLIGHSDVLNDIAFSPAGIVATAAGSPPPDTRETTIKLWRMTDGVLIRTLPGHFDGTTSVDFAPDGATLASGGRDDRIRLWRTSDGLQVGVITVNGGRVNAIAYSPDGSILASANSNATVKLWDVETGALLRTMTMDYSPSSISFSPDGTRIAAGLDGYGNNVLLFRISDGALVRTFPGHPWGFVHAVSFTPDGQGIVSSSGYTFEIFLWNVADGTLLESYDRETGWGPWPALPLSFAPDGNTFAFGRADAGVAIARNPLIPTTTVSGEYGNGSTIAFAAHPNPFARETVLELRVPAEVPGLETRILDVAGRVVRRFEVGRMGAGEHVWTWDGRNASGDAVPPGLYFADIRVDGANVAGGKLIRLDARE